MKFKSYYRNLTPSERKAFAQRARTTVNYLENHLIPARKQPRRDLLERLATASEGKVEYDDVLEHFFKHGDGGSAIGAARGVSQQKACP